MIHKRINYFILFCVMLQDISGQLQIVSKSRNTFEDLIKLTEQQRVSDLRIQYPEAFDRSRRQPKIPEWYPFPCANQTQYGRSKFRPNSVHKLRPGDIDVIGAMGDSLVAGNGAMEQWALGTFVENRGISWCAGGQGTWREHLTLPNILKQFNPNITGYSTGTGEFLSSHSRLNVAYPVSADADALHQAYILVNKIRQDRKIDLYKDWKMITIFFGANDLCSGQCYGPAEATPNQHARKLMAALDYLQKELPRTFVNLIPVLDVSVSLRIKRTMMCRLLHTMFCSCFHQLGPVDEMEQITSLVRGYQKAEEQLVFSGRYDKKDDFTVVIQPFMKLFNAPLDKRRQYDEVIDISYITYDCFHFSQKGHALGANLLWNNLLEPTGKKSMNLPMNIMSTFKCPSQNAPYLFTNINSKKFLETGTQEL